MSGVEIHDLKYGSGVRTKPGDIVELRYQVADSYVALDSNSVLQSNWSPGDPSLTITLGSSQLRMEIEENLVDLPVGTVRRFLIPAGVWDDVDREIVVGIDVQAIVGMHSQIVEDPLFDEFASAVPLEELSNSGQLDEGLLDIIDAALSSGHSRGREKILRLRLPLGMYAHLNALLNEKGLSARLRFGVKEIGTLSGGDYEIEMGTEDATILRDAVRGLA